MTQLTFSGRSEDGKRLDLVDGEGRKFTLTVDGRLRRAVGSEPDTPGQLEIQMESTLRPRDIQARIRAGESPEAVARAAGSTVEKIMPFAAPVMAERAHVAQRAQLSSVRRRRDSGARTLGEAVASHLRSLNTDPSTVEWDAWRREDGRWTLTGVWTDAGTERSATFSFDQRGNFVTIDDDDARWLVGDAVPAAASVDTEAPADPGAVSPDELSAARQRRLSAVSPDELPLGDDAIELVADPPPAGAEAGPTAAETTLDLDRVSADQPLDPFLGDSAGDDSALPDSALPDPALPDPALPDSGQSPGDSAADAPEGASPEAEQDADDRPSPRRPRKRGRASVPSWDEIMFGGGKGD